MRRALRESKQRRTRRRSGGSTLSVLLLILLTSSWLAEGQGRARTTAQGAVAGAASVESQWTIECARRDVLRASVGCAEWCGEVAAVPTRPRSCDVTCGPRPRPRAPTRGSQAAA